MEKKFRSFSKRLSRRILIICIVTITVLALFVIAYVTIGYIKMTDAYFISELKASNESVARILGKTDQNSFYQYMRRIDEDINDNTLFADLEKKGDKDFWVYSIVIDSVGHYLYHPDKQRIGTGNFIKDIHQPEWLKAVLDTSANNIGQEQVTIDGSRAYIYYFNRVNTSWTNAIIVPNKILILTTNLAGVILLTIIVLGLLLTYWVSRITIRHSTRPLQDLAKSADEVAKGNFHAPLPELKHNDEIRLLRDSFGNMQQSLTQYIEQLKTTTSQKAAFESELNIAREIQMSIVPTVFPELGDLNLYGSMTPAKAVGGDLYDFYVRDKELVFCIGDVSGKGVPAALFMTMVRSLFRAYSNGESMPDRIVTQMNHDLSQNNESCMFVTLFVGILDMESGLLRYCNAGHEPPIIIGQEAHALDVEFSFPVGAVPDTVYQMQTVVLEQGSSMLFYTDGLNEAMNAEKKEFGEERIFNELNKAIQAEELAPKALIERLIQAVHDFVGDTEQSDDLTLLCIRKEKRRS